MLFMYSIWRQEPKKTKFNSLDGDKNVDVLVIGGGIAGVLCAYMMKEAGVDCLLLEADEIGAGVSANTSAKITMQHGLIYHKIVKEYGLEYAALYAEAQIIAMEMYDKLCAEIDCDYQLCDSYVYSLDKRHIIEKETSVLDKLGIGAEFVKDTELPFSIAGAVKMKNQAQFHPLKFLYAVAEGLDIAENTKVLKIESDNCVITDKGHIRAKKIIVATHFPLLNKKGFYFLKMYQHRSYVTALENAPCVQGIYVDEAEDGMSFRNYKNLLFVGGGDHRTGKQGGAYGELSSFAKMYYPHAKEVCKWATQDCITLDGIPYIGKYSKSSKNIFVTTGFNKWGMTSAMAGAMILRDLVLENRNDYAKVFSPSRSLNIRKLISNGANAALSLITPTVPRCPHMGCALKYNKAERTWDCPCHGSRFDENGKNINEPAVIDIKINNKGR